MKILIICRDNIGDLILTTPLMRALAETLPCQIDVLVNSYNAEVLKDNPHVSTLYTYKKIHHRDPTDSPVKIILNRIKTLLAIRHAHYDVAIIGKGRWDKRALHWVKYAGVKRVIAMGEQPHAKITDLIPLETDNHIHFTEHFQRMLAPLGIHTPPGQLVLNADQEKVAQLRKQYGVSGQLPVIALQISSRKASQRWPVEHFIALIQRIATTIPGQMLLLWSPGAADNPRHPGDDGKAAQIAQACRSLPLIPIPTTSLSELFVAMSLCDFLVTSDGGAMHVGAGLGKPIVALFGDSDAVHWAPWQVPYKLLQSDDRNVSSLSVDGVFNALQSLLAETEAQLAG